MSFSMSLGETKLIFESKLTRFRLRSFCFCFFLNWFFFLPRLAKILDLTRGLFLTTVLGLVGLVGLGGLVGTVVGLGLLGLGL